MQHDTGGDLGRIETYIEFLNPCLKFIEDKIDEKQMPQKR